MSSQCLALKMKSMHPCSWVFINQVLWDEKYLSYRKGKKNIKNINRFHCHLISVHWFYISASTGSSSQFMCYYNNVAKSRPGKGRFSLADIDPCLCIHLIYAFAGMQNNRIIPQNADDMTNYQTLNTLKNRLEKGMSDLVSIMVIVATHQFFFKGGSEFFCCLYPANGFIFIF